MSTMVCLKEGTSKLMILNRAPILPSKENEEERFQELFQDWQQEEKPNIEKGMITGPIEKGKMKLLWQRSILSVCFFCYKLSAKEERLISI